LPKARNTSPDHVLAGCFPMIALGTHGRLSMPNAGAGRTKGRFGAPREDQVLIEVIEWQQNS